MSSFSTNNDAKNKRNFVRHQAIYTDRCVTRLPAGEVDMSVAPWEYWTVATMLITTHGEAAEERAHLMITEAREKHDHANVTVWTAILAKIGEIRSQT